MWPTLTGNHKGLPLLFEMILPEVNPPIELTQADINDDGVINVQDLAIIGGNYEISGCQAW